MELEAPQFSTILGPLYLAPTTMKSSGFSLSSNHALPLFQILALYPLEQAKETQWSDCNEISKMTTHTRTQNLLYYKDRQTWEVQSLPLDSKTIFGLPDRWRRGAPSLGAPHKHFSDDLSHPSIDLKMVRLKFTAANLTSSGKAGSSEQVEMLA